MLNNLTVFASKKTKGYKHDSQKMANVTYTGGRFTFVWLMLPLQEEDLPLSG